MPASLVVSLVASDPLFPSLDLLPLSIVGLVLLFSVFFTVWLVEVDSEADELVDSDVLADVDAIVDPDSDADVLADSLADVDSLLDV